MTKLLLYSKLDDVFWFEGKEKSLICTLPKFDSSHLLPWMWDPLRCWLVKSGTFRKCQTPQISALKFTLEGEAKITCWTPGKCSLVAQIEWLCQVQPNALNMCFTISTLFSLSKSPHHVFMINHEAVMPFEYKKPEKSIFDSPTSPSIPKIFLRFEGFEASGN